MAQVFLAKQEGIGNFEKLVVVKRIEPRRRHDKKLVRMFLAEARVSARLRHPNIVEIFDVGVESDDHFIVMEYLSGENLRVISETLAGRGETVPVAIAGRIVASIAAGLHHAHCSTDAAGNPRPVIHRDVTPSNLIVCYNGAVKLVDFGIAKALHDREDDDATRDGVIKGKLSYLAPEQVQHGPADERTDVFQLGIVLHELLTGRRLFGGTTAREKILAITTRTIPAPSSVNPQVPAVLDLITMRALERDPEVRLQSADELRRGLEQALANMGSYISDHDIGAWMLDSFPDMERERRRLEQHVTAGMATGDRTTQDGRDDRAGESGRGTRGDDEETVSLAAAVAPARIPPADRVGGRAGSPRTASGKSGGRKESAGISAGAGDPGEAPVAVPGEALVVEPTAKTITLTGQMISASDLARSAQAAVEAESHPAVSAAARGVGVASGGAGRQRWPYAMVAVAGLAVVGLLGLPGAGHDDGSSGQESVRLSGDERGGPGAVPGSSGARAVPEGPEAGQVATPASQSASRQPPAGATETPGQTADDGYSVSVKARPASATLEVDGVTVGVGSFSMAMPRDASRHLLLVKAPGYEPRVVMFSASNPPPAIVRLVPIPRRSRRASPARRPGGDRAGASASQAGTPSSSAPSAGQSSGIDEAPETTPLAEDRPPRESRTDNLDPWVN